MHRGRAKFSRIFHNFTEVAGPSTFINALQDGLKCHIRRDGVHLTSQIIRSPWIPITALNNVFLQSYKYLLMWSSMKRFNDKFQGSVGNVRVWETARILRKETLSLNILLSVKNVASQTSLLTTQKNLNPTRNDIRNSPHFPL